MFEKGIDWRASLAAITPDKSFLSISFTRSGVESSEPLKEEVAELSETVELTSTNSHVLAP